MNLESLAFDLREFEGVSRKKSIAEIFHLFENVREEYGNVLADFGDDAAVIDIGEDNVILFAADGIWGKITEKSPWWTGYTSVVVNVNDIAAMGGKPIAMVNVMSSGSIDCIKSIMEGIRDGVNKFGVPMVGGHTHPDTPYNSLAVAVIGIAKKDCIIRSDTANPGDIVIFAYDMDGKIGANSSFSWDTTSFKDSKNVRKSYLIMSKIAEQKLVTSGKDISNPGSIGTLGMLCETSKVGADIDINKIPVPSGIELDQWLKMYPATGYIVTAKSDNVQACIDIFSEVGITAVAVGTINNTNKIELYDKYSKVVVFDFDKEIITGIEG